MLKGLLTMVFLLLTAVAAIAQQGRLESDVIRTADGDLEITFVGHGSLIFVFNGRVIHVDPYSPLADYASLPKADLILLTHEHRDHLDVHAIDKIRIGTTRLIYPQSCARTLEGGLVMKNGDVVDVDGLKIEAVPAYNLVHKRDSGQPFHLRGDGNGYVLTFGDKRVYVAGDTENTPEMKALKDIDVAFLPMNLPYTMTPEMVADAALAFQPKILYPYHYGDTDTSRIVELLRDAMNIDVRIRQMK